ncbi:peptidylprolyl isomerase [Streptomonospora sp. PA3]|nr:peptidylprolyl isomerase [Streptomonospora sp. PA3]
MASASPCRRAARALCGRGRRRASAPGPPAGGSARLRGPLRRCARAP